MVLHCQMINISFVAMMAVYAHPGLRSENKKQKQEEEKA